MIKVILHTFVYIPSGPCGEGFSAGVTLTGQRGRCYGIGTMTAVQDRETRACGYKCITTEAEDNSEKQRGSERHLILNNSIQRIASNMADTQL